MGTSAFDPIVLADVRSVKNKIDISGITTGNPFSVGDVVRYDANTDKYLLAKADSQTNATILGVIESLSGNDMTIVYSGEINLPDSLFASMTGATAAQVLYLSDSIPGKLTATAPTNQGSIIKPVVVVSGTTDSATPAPLGNIDGIVINTTGTVISGDSTVDVSDIQPVGSISAFAGATANIPSGWELCDGGLLSATTYSDLFSALGNGSIYGFAQNATLTYNASSTFQLNASNLVGARFTITRSGVAPFTCTILSGTMSGNNITNAEVLVEAMSTDGLQYHNSLLVTSDLTSNMQILNNGVYIAVNAVYTITAGSKSRFRKPDMRSRFVVGDSRGLTGLQNTTFNSYTLGMFGGEEEHTLTTNEIPLHTHDLSLSAVLSGNVTVQNNLSIVSGGGHAHKLAANEVVNFNAGTPLADSANSSIAVDTSPTGGLDRAYRLTASNSNPEPSLGRSSIDGSHTHTISGNILVSTANLTPVVTGSASGVGANSPHSNVPQHIAMYWIIKVRKDSYAKILKLGPSSGGAVLAKNTAKKWGRMATPGAGATFDISYGTWGIQRIGAGHYVLTHNYINDVDGNTAEAAKYIVETTVSKTRGSNAMLVSNAYGTTGGYTFGVQIYDVVGAAYSDSFDFLNIVMYGGGTAI